MDDSEIIARYQEVQCSETVGAEAGVSASTVLNICRAAGVPIQPRGRAGKALNAFRTPGGWATMTMAQVVQAYVRDGKSGPQIAKEANVTPGAVYAVLKRHNVPRRAAVDEMVRASRQRAKEQNAEKRAAGKSNLILPSAIDRLRAKL